MIQFFKKVTTNAFDWFLYSVLSEKQKNRLANMFSDQQKNRIKQLTKYGKKHNQKIKVKKIKDHLYTLGFSERALNQLMDLLRTEEDPFMKRLVAWELTLWYANHYTAEGAKEALTYIQTAEYGEKDKHQLRRIAILKAECLDRINETSEAKSILKHAISQEKHPDLMLAIANLEEDISTRLVWINKVYAHFQLQPITFKDMTAPEYDGLIMATQSPKIVEGPKVSVILPAYNAEVGIEIAIESILNQTWSNLELLIVDDCSPDNTKMVAENYAKLDNRIKVLSTPQNSGPYIARNIALQHASGKYITVNDADDWSHEKKLEIQVTHLEENPHIIANTSAHARLTEDLLLYRRGTPGRYLFPNMSSIMFRKDTVMQKLGYWDSVRFAADGEFKRRLIRTFGKESYVDLQSGPLSLPRQSVTSLTGSSAFGYNGFFMGVRKEYVESLENYHDMHEDLYFPYPSNERPFPVPEPMWPNRDNKQNGNRVIPYVIVADFREGYMNTDKLKGIINIIKNLGGQIGFVQVYHYNIDAPLKIASEVRQFIDGRDVQMLVFGENITTEKVILLDYNVLEDTQKYIPQIDTGQVGVLMDAQITRSKEEVKNQVSSIFGSNVTFICQEQGSSSEPFILLEEWIVKE